MKSWTVFLLLACAACNRGSDVPRNDHAKAALVSGTPSKIEGLDVLSYSIHTPSDTIEYIKIGTDTTTAKPTILFLQGSLPAPLIFNMGSYKHINLPFDHAALAAEYNIVEISMPKTPVEVATGHLNADYNYVPDTASPGSFSKAYLKGNYLENYVERAELVIADLMTKQWVLKDSLILIGHSQGAKVAAVVAVGNRQVACVALLGFNAYGRYDVYVRNERGRLRSGQVSDEECLADMDSLYQRWKDINATPNDAGKGHLNWTTFSINYVPYLLKIQAPIFIGYGTEDLGAANCDLLPLEFISHGKTNYTLKPYFGMDHNFFELKNGVPDRRGGAHWTEVVQDVIEFAHAKGKGTGPDSRNLK